MLHLALGTQILALFLWFDSYTRASYTWITCRELYMNHLLLSIVTVVVANRTATMQVKGQGHCEDESDREHTNCIVNPSMARYWI